jgi:hypothetical protein
LDILFDGEIAAILLMVAGQGADALNDGIRAEVSFASTNTFSTNDSRAAIISAEAYQGFLTTGGSQVGQVVSIQFGDDGIPIAAGERMYLHVAAQGTLTSRVAAYLYTRTSGRARPDRRRL